MDGTVITKPVSGRRIKRFYVRDPIDPLLPSAATNEERDPPDHANEMDMDDSLPEPPDYPSPRQRIDAIIPADDDEYEVESIIRHRQAGSRRGGRMLYTIKWATYKETTEEPEENLGNAILLLHQYQEDNGIPLTVLPDDE
jgi:hypothetical protein